MTARTWDWLGVALALATAAAGAWVALSVFEGIPHLEDEFAYTWQAHVMAEGAISRPSPEHADAFLVPFVVDFEGQRFGKYPPGWPALLSVGVRAGVPWLINPLLGGLAIWLSYRLGGRFLRKGLAWLGALLLALSPMLWMLSGSQTSHNLSLVLALSFTLSWLDLLPMGTRRTAAPSPLLIAVAGGSLGLLALTRPLTSLAVALPFGLDGLLQLRQKGRAGRRLLGVGLVAAGVAGLLPIWNAALIGDPFRNPYTLWWSYDRIGFGPGHGVMPGGHNLHLAYQNTKLSLATGLHDAFGWPYLSWLFLPFGLGVLRRHREARLTLSLFPVLVLLYAVYWIGAWLLGPRYYYAGLPGLAVASAAGIGWLGGWLKDRSGPRWRRLMVVALVAGLVVVDLVFYLPARIGGLRGLYGIERAKMATVAEAGIEPALVIVQADHWSEYATLRLLSAPFSDRDLRVAWSGGAAADARLRQTWAELPAYYFDAETSTLQPAVAPNQEGAVGP